MRRIALPLALATMFVAPAAAIERKGVEDDPVRVGVVRPDPRFGGPGGINVFGNVAANEVTVEIESASGRYLVRDPDGAVPEIVAHPYACESVDATTVGCPQLGPNVSMRLRGGDDSLSVGPGVTGSVTGTTNAGADSIVLARDYPSRLYVRAGPGADELSGGTANDQLFGQAGTDQLRGRAGDDKIEGETGRDRASGGAGDDRLLMKQNDRDKSIDCGSGDDRAVIDRKLDPEPQGCERIKAKPAR